jgi:hypothetical protein
MVTGSAGRGGCRLERLEAVFDDERVVANAGLVVAATLCDRLDLERLVDESVSLAGGRESAVAGARDAARCRLDRRHRRAPCRRDTSHRRPSRARPLDARDVPARFHVRACAPARPGARRDAAPRLAGRCRARRGAACDRCRLVRLRGPRRPMRAIAATRTKCGIYATAERVLMAYADPRPSSRRIVGERALRVRRRGEGSVGLPDQPWLSALASQRERFLRVARPAGVGCPHASKRAAGLDLAIPPCVGWQLRLPQDPPRSRRRGRACLAGAWYAA